MTSIVQLMKDYSDNSGNIVIPDNKKVDLVDALMNIRKSSVHNDGAKKKKKKDPNAPKRPTSAYMIWLNKNRDNIKSEYFSDYTDITDWSLESKCKYYESKGLKIPTDDGKPRIVALVTAKAGLVWKEMSSEEKEPFNKLFKEAQDNYEVLKASYVPTNQSNEYKVPEGWSGPHLNMEIEKSIKDDDGKTIKIFKTFDEAVKMAISLDSQCFGVTQTNRGFSVKIGKMTTSKSAIASWKKENVVKPVKYKRGRPKNKLEDSDDE